MPQRAIYVEFDLALGVTEVTKYDSVNYMRQSQCASCRKVQPPATVAITPLIADCTSDPSGGW
jgi:hypothetical protein